jgi:drug/metabolite transporter (DMT)-like permease
MGLRGEGSGALAFLTRPWIWPAAWDLFILLVMGAFAAAGMMCFITAYSLAAASFVAPFEYSAMLWAVLYGLVLFGDSPDMWHIAGMAVVVGAGLFMMAFDSRSHRG